MKMISPKVYRFLIIAFFSVTVWACQQDPNHVITQKWEMVDNDLTLDIRADSSYIAIENQGKPQVGTWRLSENSKTIAFRQKDNPVVSMDIVTLNEQSLVLDNNGEEMTFKPAGKQ